MRGVVSHSSSLWTPPKASIGRVFHSNLIGFWDARFITGVADGGAVSSMTDSSGNGNTATQGSSGYRPTYRATGWSDGGACIEFIGGNNTHLRVDSLANLFGVGGTNFTVAILLRMTVNTGGCAFGFGSNSGGGVFAQHHVHNNLVSVTKTGGGEGTISNDSPAWMHPWVPMDGSPVAQDSLVIWSCDQSSAKAGFLWFNGHKYAVNTGSDDSATYQNLALGALLMAGTLYNPISAKVRMMAIMRGLADDRWIASCVEYFGRRDLLHHVIRIDGDSIPVNSADGGNAAWPALVTLTPSDVNRKAAQSGAAQLMNIAVGGRSIADVGAPYANGESAANVYDPSSIDGGVDVIGILGNDENGDANYDPNTPTICFAFVGRHEIDRGYTARQLVDRYWKALDRVRAAAPNNHYVACTMLPAVIAGIDETVTQAANVLIVAEYPQHADDIVRMDLAPGLQNPSVSGYQDESGIFVHLNSAGRALAAAYVQTQLPRIRANTHARQIARMMI